MARKKIGPTCSGKCTCGKCIRCIKCNYTWKEGKVCPSCSTPARIKRVKLKHENAFVNANLIKMAEDLEKRADDRDENISLEAVCNVTITANERLRRAAVHLRSAYAELQAMPLRRFGQCARCFEFECECLGGRMR